MRLLPAVALALSLTPQLAAADTEEPLVTTLVAPVDGDVDVPTDTLVWLDADSADGADELRLRATDGDEVPLARVGEITTTVTTVTAWQPERTLLADTRYALWQCDQTDCTAKLTEFRTRSGPADADPPVPVVTRLVESDDHIETDIDFRGLLVVAAGAADLDADERTGDVLAVGLPGQPIAFVAHQSVNSVHLGAYDLSGRFSGFSDSLPLEREKTPVCDSCSVTDDPPVALLMLLMLLGVRRRR